MRALAVQGIFATDCHAQLHELLLRYLGPAHARLLAEPQHDAATDSIDWYADCPGTAVRCRDLPPDEAAAVKARAASLAADIGSLARRLADRQQDAHALSGGLLALTCLHHDADDLYVVNGQPVLVNWGYAAGMDGVLPQDLARLGTAAPAPAVAPVTPAPPLPPQRAGCAGWLLPLLLLLLLLWLLLAALGWLPLWLPASCVPQPNRSALQVEQERASRLESELDSLLRQLREKAELCRPALPPAPDPAPAPEPPAEQPRADVVEPFFGETPVEPDPVPAPKPNPAPAPPPPPPPPPKPAPRKGEAMQIPKDAAQKKDLSFLEGCWVSETGLFSYPANKPVIAEYCFDKNGKGSRFEREEGGDVCRGPGKARFKGNRLYMESEYARCPGGQNYVPHWIECTGTGNSTLCNGREGDDPKGTRWKARFTRK